MTPTARLLLYILKTYFRKEPSSPPAPFPFRLILGLEKTIRATNRPMTDRSERNLFLLDQASGEHHTIAVIVQLDREDQHIPCPMRTLDRQVRGSTKTASINVSLACIRYGADDRGGTLGSQREPA